MVPLTRLLVKETVGESVFKESGKSEYSTLNSKLLGLLYFLCFHICLLTIYIFLFNLFATTM